MRLASSLQPRDGEHAVRVASWLCAVSAVITFGFAVLDPATGAMVIAATYAVPLGLCLLSLMLLRLPARYRPLAALLTPLLGVAVVAGLGLLTADTSAAAQVFFCVPVLYAASHLRARGAVLVVVCAALAETVLVLTLLPLEIAVPDLTYVNATLVVITVLLTRSHDRQEQLVDALRVLASTDGLTGLLTRRSLDESLTTALGAADLRSTDGVALIVVDVDDFKAVNDTWGHPVGDDALVQIAACVRAAAGRDAEVGRIGGDEFVVVLAATSADAARRLATEIVDAVQSLPLRLAGGQRVGLSVTVGVPHTRCVAVPVSATMARLYAGADSDLYRVKHARLPPSPRAAPAPS